MALFYTCRWNCSLDGSSRFFRRHQQQPLRAEREWLIVHSAKAFPLVTSLRSTSKIEKSRSSYSVKAKVKSRARESASRLFIAARIGAGALWHFWLYRGYLTEGRNVLERILLHRALRRSYGEWYGIA